MSQVERSTLLLLGASIVVVASLGCGGLIPLDTEQFTTEALAIQVLSGDVVVNTDFGDEGDYDVELGALGQSLAWGPIDPEFSANDRMAAQIEVVERLLVEASDSSSADWTSSTGTSTIGGQAAHTYSIEFGFESIEMAIWHCPLSNVWVSMSTSDAFGMAGDLHSRSLESVVCGDAVPTLVERELNWSFVGDNSEWTVHTVPSPPGSGDWNHTETGAALTLANQAALVDDEVPELCEVSLGYWLDTLEATPELTVEESSIRTTESGCQARWEGRYLPEDQGRSGLIEYHHCGESGYTSDCVLFGTGSLDLVCRGVSQCSE